MLYLFVTDNELQFILQINLKLGANFIKIY